MTTPDLSNIEPMPAGDIRGILAINNLPAAEQRAEDATAMADRDRHRILSPRGHERPATIPERLLLARLRV